MSWAQRCFLLLRTTVKCRTFHGSGSKLDMNRIHIEMIWIRSIEIGSPHIMGAAVLPILLKTTVKCRTFHRSVSSKPSIHSPAWPGPISTRKLVHYAFIPNYRLSSNLIPKKPPPTPLMLTMQYAIQSDLLMMNITN